MTSMEREGSSGEYGRPALMERRVDGILLAAPQMGEDRAAARVLERTEPPVSLYRVPGARVPPVWAAHALSGRLRARPRLPQLPTVTPPTPATRQPRMR